MKVSHSSPQIRPMKVSLGFLVLSAPFIRSDYIVGYLSINIVAMNMNFFLQHFDAWTWFLSTFSFIIYYSCHVFIWICMNTAETLNQCYNNETICTYQLNFTFFLQHFAQIAFFLDIIIFWAMNLHFSSRILLRFLVASGGFEVVNNTNKIVDYWKPRW